MVEISKHMFENACRDVHCSTLLHPWHQSCWTSSLTTYTESFIGSAKFYLVIHLAQNLMRGKKVLQRRELIKAGENYARSTLLGALVSGSCSTLACLLRWLLGGKFTYYTYLFVPFTLNGICIYLEPPSRRGLIVNLFVNLVIEYWMRSMERAGYMSITPSKQTFMFMLGSALLFYLMRLEGDKEKRTPLLWLFTPEKVRHKVGENDNVCPHNGPCLKYILKGTLGYFSAGLAFTVAKAVLPKIRSPMKALSSLRKSHLALGLFFGSYIGIYRTVICYLCRKQGVDSALYALPAGYLAGLSFIIKPSFGFAIGALTAAFKLYSTILYEKKILSNKVPIPEMIYCFCQGTLFHARFMHPEVCPGYVANLIRSVSNGRSEELYANLLEAVKRVAI